MISAGSTALRRRRAAQPSHARRGGRPCARGAGVAPALRSAGENEPPQRRQHRIEHVDPAARGGRRRRRRCRLSRHASAILRDGSASRAPDGEQVPLHLDDHLRQLGLAGEHRSREPQPCVQLVDVAVGRHARIRLRARACRRTGRSPRCRPSWCRFSPLGDYKAHRGSKGSPRSTPEPAARQRVPPAAPRQWYPAQRTRPAVAQHRRPVSHPRLRGDAAADAGGSRAAEVPRVARRSIPSLQALADAPRRDVDRDLAAARLQHPAAAAPRDRARVGRALRRRAAVATRRRCGRSRASASTRPARS